MDLDILLIDAEGPRRLRQARSGRLTGGPHLKLAVLEASRTVLRFKGNVREKWIGISGLDHVRSFAERGVDIPIFAQYLSRLFLRKVDGVAGVALRALRRGWAFLPANLEFVIARVAGLIPAVGNDGDAAGQGARVGTRLNDESVAYPGQHLNLIKIRVGDLAFEDRTFLVIRVKHSGHVDVDSVKWLARDDLLDVGIRRILPDDPIILGIFHLERFRIGRWHRRSLKSKFTVAKAATSGGVVDTARRRGAL